MKIDIDYVIGTAYYIGDGKSTTSRSLATSNYDYKILKFYIKWLTKYFNAKNENIKIHIKVSKNKYNKRKIAKEWSKKLGIKLDNINSISKKYKGKSHHKTLIEIALHNTNAKKKFDSLITVVKSKCLKDKKLAVGYIRGIMAAEGSPKYNAKSASRSVHLKMKNENEIKYIGKLLNNVLKIESSVIKVKSEEGMWLIIISGYDELEKLSKINIFGICSDKKEKFDMIIQTYKRRQVKKGHVAEFYIKNLAFYNKKSNRHLTAPELSKLIKRDRTRTINVLKKLERENLIKSRRRKTTGRPFEFWIEK